MMQEVVNKMVLLSKLKQEDEQKIIENKKEAYWESDFSNDVSTCCNTEDDLNIEKINIFSKIIKDKNQNDIDLSYMRDLENNINEQEPLIKNGKDIQICIVYVNEMNNRITSIHTNMEKIQIIKKKIELNIYDNEKLYKKVNHIIHNTELIIQRISFNIKELNLENEEYKNRNPSGNELKIRLSIFKDILEKYKNCVNKYKTLCNQYYEHLYKVVKRKCKLMYPYMNEYTIIKMMKENNSYQQESKQEKEKTNESNVVQMEIQKLQEQYELKKIENNISSLNEVYIELAYTIKKIQNVISNIENNIYPMKSYSDSTLLTHQTKKNKIETLSKQKLICFSIFLLMIIFICSFPFILRYVMLSLNKKTKT